MRQSVADLLLLLLLLFCCCRLPGISGFRTFPHSSNAGGRLGRSRLRSTLHCANKPKAFQYDVDKIRNFCIIAHVDHGKSTLADRILEFTNTIPARSMQQQVLDNNPIERERGITIKLQAVRILYNAKDGEQYLLNLIDTPGHVDFGYEVSRSLAACEGALLVVDATQGVEAQTLANVHLAKEHGLKILPVVNKIDLPSADPEKCAVEISTSLGLSCDNLLLCSAKTGDGIEHILEAIVNELPSPARAGKKESPTRALIFDSYFDQYKGVVPFVRVVDGTINRGDRLRFFNSNAECDALEVGYMTPSHVQTNSLQTGEVGYIAGSIRSLSDAGVGDTVTVIKRNARQHDGSTSYMTSASDSESSGLSAIKALPGYRPAKPMVFAGFYPVDSADYEKLRDAMSKLILNDASFQFAPESSAAMGFGFRCGFLGLLHMDVIQERLEREYDMDIVVTSPSVVYKTILPQGGEVFVDCPSKLPEVQGLAIEEPYVKLELIVPTDFVGELMTLAQSRRAVYVDMVSLSENRMMLIYEVVRNLSELFAFFIGLVQVPLAEVITDFFDQVKSLTRGYGSMSMYDIGYRAGDLVKLDIRINGELAPPLASASNLQSLFYC
jgi:GTP-binding protein LepA